MDRSTYAEQAVERRSALTIYRNNTKWRQIVHWLLPKVVSVSALITIWQLLVWTGWANTKIIPPPLQLISATRQLISTGELGVHVLASSRRVVVGFLIASVCGVSSGLILGSSRRLSDCITPLIELLRPIPPIAWIPLAILWFGIGDRPAFFIVALGAFFPIFINSFAGIWSVSHSHIAAARCLGADRRLLLTDVLIPAALPHILTGLRIGLGIAWTSVIAAELVGAQSGLGYMIQTNRILLRTDKIVVGMAMIGVVGLFMNTGMVALENRWLKWKKQG